MRACHTLLAVAVGAMCSLAAAAPAPYCDAAGSAYEVADVFGRRLGQRPLTLPDWEGYMANPAISLSVRRSDNVAGALDVVVASSDLALVHFDLPSEVGEQGASKTLDVSAGPAAQLFAAVFPQRDKRRLHASLTIASSQAACVVKVDIVPVHAAPQSTPYPFNVDFSQDRSGFFDDPRRRQVFQQALSDWAFFVDGKDAPVTEAGREITWIWDQTGFTKGRVLANAGAFQGYLLYAYGVSSELLRAVAALRPLAIDAVAAPVWRAGCPAQYRLGATGRLPYYDWQLVDGHLPKGLALDRFSGVISGTPAAAGQAQVVVQLRDHELSAVRQTVSLEVTRSRRRCRP